MPDQIVYLTYEEAANVLGIVPTSVYQLVSEKRLHSVKVPGTNRKKLSRAEVEAYKKGRSVQQFTYTPQETPIDEELDKFQPMPTTTVQDMLRLVNEGFSQISKDHEKISEQYRETVSPIINHAISAPEREIIDQMSALMQTLLNNAIMMIKTPNISNATPEQVVKIMLNGLPIPEQFQELLAAMGVEVMTNTAIREIAVR